MLRHLHLAISLIFAICAMNASVWASEVAGRSASHGPSQGIATWPRWPELDRAIGGRNGGVVVVDPSNGQILGIGGPLEALRAAAAPGSIAKIVTAYAALRSGRMTPERRIRCTGEFAGHRCRRAHGWLRLKDALALSCTSFFLRVGAESGAKALEQAAAEFGFGYPTGVDPAESPGRVLAENAQSTLELASGLGPAFAVTPLQLARAMAALGNGGDILPLWISGSRPPSISTRLETRHVQAIRVGLFDAVRIGTASGLATLGREMGWRIFAKTGTAVFERQVGSEPSRWYGHVVTYVDASPASVVVVSRVEGRSGAHDAVPLAVEALRAWRLRTVDWPNAIGRGQRTIRTMPPRSRHIATLRVRLFSLHVVDELRVRVRAGTLALGGRRYSLWNHILTLSSHAGRLRVCMNERKMGNFPSAVIEGASNAAIELEASGIPPARDRWRQSTKKRRIRGELAIMGQSPGKGLLVIARLSLPDYARGVAVSELDPKWPNAMLTAQSIVAATFALRHRSRHEPQGADVCDMTHCQLFRGVSDLAHQTIPSDDALLGSRKIVWGGEPIEALYHAACGGQTRDNEEVFGGNPLPYLRGRPDPWCRRHARARPWSVTIPWREMTRALGADSAIKLGTIHRLTVNVRSPSGAAAIVELEGSRGKTSLGSHRLWRTIGTRLGWHLIKSARYGVLNRSEGALFFGRGLGHGVGLCQWGAYEQALQGRSASQILSYYFPGTRLEWL